jgi:CTP synthase
MIQAAEWARLNNIPFFGISLGMHIMVIEWCRNVLGWADADSAEFNQDTRYPVISLPEEHGAIRLGLGEIVTEPETHLFTVYNQTRFSERHRHRYELSGKRGAELSGLKIAARSPDGSLVEAVEWPDHPWGVGVQFHPEYKSKPTAAAPLFRDFIQAVKKRSSEQ